MQTQTAPVVTDIHTLKVDFWPEEESADDFNEFIGERHKADRIQKNALVLLNWFCQLAEHGRVPPEDYAQLDYVYRSEEEVRTMLVAALERERKNIYAKGEADGFVKGEAAGMEVQRQTILQLLHFRFNLGEEEQNRIAKELGQLQTLAQLQRLTNGLLNPTARLEDFAAQLASYLSSNHPT